MATATAAARPQTQRAEAAKRVAWPGAAALGLLCVVYVLLAALPAYGDSGIVLGSPREAWPGWVVGPLSFAGVGGHALVGPLFYAGLWVALLLYVVVLVRVGDLPVRAVLWTILGLHVLFLLAPPLLSRDVFSYIAYARLGVGHSLNPYTHAPVDIRADSVFPYAGSVGAVSVYGPLFTLLTYPLASVSLAGVLWTLKALAAACSLGIVALVWKGARLLGRDPVVAAAFVGLNPIVLVHVVGGAHNEALAVLLTVLGLVVWVRGQRSEVIGTALASVAAGVKASAGLVVPFLIVGDRRQWRQSLVAAVLVLAAIAAIGFAVFGTHALDALSFLNSNQARSSRWSFPYKTAQLLGLVLPGGRVEYRTAARVLWGVAFGCAFVWLLWRTWRGEHPVRMAGWATFAILVASAWLVPWYALWLLPLAALAGDRALMAASVALCGWMLVIAVPL